MGFYRKITSFLQSSKTTASFTDAERALRWQQLQDDPGKFIYEADGFRYPFKERDEKLNWSAIERIVAYKEDWMTVDEICLDILSGGWTITFSESLPGWYQLLIKLKQVFPAIPENWDGEIIQPAFATNYTVLYEREDRQMPQSNNFYAWLASNDPLTIIAVFEEQGWGVRKAGRTEWELTNVWSKLHIEPNDRGILLNGEVAFHPDNVAIMDSLLDKEGVAYQYEFYNAEKELLLERKLP